ncbi:MAG: ATP-dependent DNA helicase RecG [Myxococcota bacterium]
MAKPLEFAARDDFVHMGRIRDLEKSVAGAARAALELAIPSDARKILRRIVDDLESASDGPASPAVIRRALEGARALADPAWSEAALERSPAVLPGIGPKRAETLARRGLATIADLLFHLPVRYDDRRALLPLADLEVGRRATCIGRVLVSGFVSSRGSRRGRRPFEAVVEGGGASVRLKWFHGTDAIAAMAQKNALLLITGDVTRYRFDKQIVHPEIEPLTEEEVAGRTDSPRLNRIVPDYAAPEGLHPRALRRLLERAVGEYADLVMGHLPADLVRERGLPSPSEALRHLHCPDPDVDLAALGTADSPARSRLILEELYLLELGLALRRASRRHENAVPVPGDVSAVRSALLRLPFQLTGAQQRAWGEIADDLSRAHPMSRLLEGDVGSGKTVVAYLAAIAVAAGGHQTAIMAPTELLAEQHARTLAHLNAASEGSGALRLALLTSSIPRADADAIRSGLAAGDVDLVVGTHALLQSSVAFHSLALIVIDEQHRFGVLQRAALAAKTGVDRGPHTLVMTATPIPRTLALTLHGDLDLSLIDELPPGRLPIRTLLLREGEGRKVADLVRETVERGEQVYVVYPLVEESAKVDLRSARESAERIRSAFPDARVDLVHGQLDAAERGAAMKRFAAGETQILVSTTVVEVGVDVPNATLMVIEHAERFGLAQLHQLRGRVGRGSAPGTCVCVARASTEVSEARLRALVSTTDGFEIADADLRIRGPGEFLGTRQSGRLPDLRIADLTRDVRQIAVARRAARATVGNDPGLAHSPELARAVQARWGDRLAVVGVG